LQQTCKQCFGVKVRIVLRTNAEMKWPTSDADDITSTHLIARSDCERSKERRTRAQSIGVFDRDVESTSHLSGKDHAPIGRCSDLRTSTRAVIDASIASHPRSRRRTKAINYFRVAWWLVINPR
jgi:hypothetical protein